MRGCVDLTHCAVVMPRTMMVLADRLLIVVVVADVPMMDDVMKKAETLK